MKAVCLCCGEYKKGSISQCLECLYSPDDLSRPLSYLFTDAHLSEDELEEAAARIKSGEAPRPSFFLLEEASQAIGLPVLARKLRVEHRFALIIGNLFLTPLLGFAFWYGLKNRRPEMAVQVLMITSFCAWFSTTFFWGVWLYFRW